jgi:hypothetical protein
MIKRGIMAGVKGFPRTGKAFNTILYSIKNHPTPEVCSVKKYNLFYLSGLLFYLAAALNFITGEGHSTAVVWLCLGSSFLCLGYSQQKK